MKKIITLMCGTFLSLATLNALQSIESISEFDSALRNKDLILAYFYTKPEKAQPDVYKLHKDINSMLKEADKQEYTPEFGEVYFIKVNISRPHLQRLARRFKMRRDNEFMLFDGGRRTATFRATRTDRISNRILRDFIKENLGRQIEEKMKRREKEEQRREEDRRRRAEERREWYGRYGAYPYWGYPYYGSYYGPYGYGGYYSHGPSFGIGFGFH